MADTAISKRKSKSFSRTYTWDGYFTVWLNWSVSYQAFLEDGTGNMYVKADITASTSSQGNVGGAANAGSDFVNVFFLAWGGSTGYDTGYPPLKGQAQASINQLKNRFNPDVDIVYEARSDYLNSTEHYAKSSGSYSGKVYFTESDVNPDGSLSVKLPIRTLSRALQWEQTPEVASLQSVAAAAVFIDIDNLKYFPWAIKQSGNWESCDRDDDYTDNWASPNKAGLRIKRNNVWDACTNASFDESTSANHGFIKRGGRWITSMLHGND